MNESFIKEINESITVFTDHLEFLRKMNEINKSVKRDFNSISDKIDLDEFDFLKSINDVNSLITISHLDLLVTIKSLYCSSNNWEKIFFIKHCYLTIFESFMTYDKYREFLYKTIRNKYPDLQDELREINKDIKDFRNQNKYYTEIYNIRNNIAGHISDDFELYYDTIIKFDGDETGKIVVKFLAIIRKLQNFLTKIMMKERVKEKEFDKVILDTEEKIHNLLKIMNM